MGSSNVSIIRDPTWRTRSAAQTCSGLATSRVDFQKVAAEALGRKAAGAQSVLMPTARYIRPGHSASSGRLASTLYPVAVSTAFFTFKAVSDPIPTERWGPSPDPGVKDFFDHPP